LEEHIQIHQENPGESVIYFVKEGATATDLEKLFDLTGLELSFKIKQIATPILSKAGKLKLKV